MEGKLVKCYYEDGSYCVKFDIGDDYVYNNSDGTNGYCKTNYEDIQPIEERCTLTDAVEKFDIDILCKKSGEHLMELNDAKAVETFKREYLYKEKQPTLENGIYEAKTRKRNDALTYIWFVSDGKAHFDKELTSRWGDASKLINPKKIAEL